MGHVCAHQQAVRSRKYAPKMLVEGDQFHNIWVIPERCTPAKQKHRNPNILPTFSSGIQKQICLITFLVTMVNM